MEEGLKPTIKGLYVNGHVDLLRAEKGEEAVKLLKERLGFPIDYKEDDDVFVGDEEKLIDECLRILKPGISEDEFDVQSGIFHFTNWAKTPWSKQLFSLLPPDFKYMMLHLSVISLKIFKNYTFEGEELGPTKVKIITKNDYYKLNHWKGIYTAWLAAFGLKGTVEAEAVAPHEYSYVITWEVPEAPVK
jgi:uncharacterized protein (TIGR02265 family)